MDTTHSPSRRGIWKILAFFSIIALLAALLTQREKQRLREPPSVFFTRLLPFPEQPFDPEPRLSPVPRHEDDPGARERLARLTAEINPWADPYEQLAVFDRIIEECGQSRDSGVRAAVGAVMTLKAGRVWDRRILLPLYDEISDRARSMASPQAQLYELWAGIGRAKLQIRRRHRQILLDRLTAKKYSADSEAVRVLLLGAKLGRVEEEDDTVERARLSSALIGEIASTHDVANPAVGKIVGEAVRIRLNDIRLIPELIEVCGRILSDCPGEKLPVFKEAVLKGTRVGDISEVERPLIARFVLEHFGADSHPALEELFDRRLRQLFSQRSTQIGSIEGYNGAIGFARENGLESVLPRLGTDLARKFSEATFPYALCGFGPGYKAPSEYWKKRTNMDQRLNWVKDIDDSERQRTAYEELARRFRQDPDVEKRALAAKAMHNVILATPEPWDRLALCDEALAWFGADAELRRREYNPFFSIVTLKAKMIMDDTPLVEYYRALAEESRDERERAKAMMKMAEPLPIDEAEPVYREIIRRFETSHRPGDLRIAVECRMKFAERFRYSETNRAKPFYYDISDAYYCSPDTWLRKDAERALNDLLFTIRDSKASTEYIHERNRLFNMMVDSAKDETQLAFVLTGATLRIKGEGENTAIAEWMNVHLSQSRSSYSRANALEARFFQVRDQGSGERLAFYNAVIEQLRGTEDYQEQSLIIWAYRGKADLSSNPAEKLRLWEEGFALTGSKPNSNSLFRKAEYLEQLGRNSGPVYDEIIAFHRKGGDFVSMSVIKALEAKYGRADTLEAKVAVLDHMIELNRSGGSCFGTTHESAIARKSQLLADPEIKRAYYLEVVEWYKSSRGRSVESIVINAFNQLAKLAETDEEQIRWLIRLVDAPKSELYSNERTLVANTLILLAEKADNIDDTIRWYSRLVELPEAETDYKTRFLVTKARRKLEDLENSRSKSPGGE